MFQIDQHQTLMYRIHASVDSGMFKGVFADVDGQKVDITKNGQLSCAVYVSALLLMSGTIDTMTATVKGLENALRQSGWVSTAYLYRGAVVIWFPQEQADGRKHEHAGFVLSDRMAVSHSDIARCPVEHELYFGGKRLIKAAYINPRLHENVNSLEVYKEEMV